LLNESRLGSYFRVLRVSPFYLFVSRVRIRLIRRIHLAYTEVYGSPDVHPQPETYWGNVNPVGPRACYDEGKRVAEALTYGYARQDGVDVRVARIFNCFGQSLLLSHTLPRSGLTRGFLLSGPRMSTDDGRLVSNFAVAALRGEPIEIYGDGQATRSLMVSHCLSSVKKEDELMSWKSPFFSLPTSSFTISFQA
jgi:nucleoside-diphosphate-sugar epimerase